MKGHRKSSKIHLPACSYGQCAMGVLRIDVMLTNQNYKNLENHVYIYGALAFCWHGNGKSWPRIEIFLVDSDMDGHVVRLQQAWDVFIGHGHQENL